MVRLAISGICGRMGKRIGLLAVKDKDFEIVAGLESPDNPAIGKDIGEVLSIAKIGKNVEADFSKIAGQCEVLIEFTTSVATMTHLETAVKKKIGMVIGTTAFSSQEIEEIKKASLKIPIVFSPNMSIGANLLFKITEEISKALGKDYRIHIVETHHRNKKDAPSGTAKRLGEVVLKIRGEMPPIKSIREREVVGDHSISFSGDVETIEITHRAHSRDAFAKGALDAARFVAGKKPGLYTMHDVIGKV
ncbi:MAG: 4-hydroxy-tetrahydrodipicolinate reductase [Candidatus Omnitrophota bacterium]